jgi:threonine dehydrogenase-like Zn-dependent dehydrogenase
MRTAVISNPFQAELRDVSVPSPRAGEIRVRLQGCGVCGSNVPVWEGRPWFEYPLDAGAPGHEGWGIVDEVAGDVTDFAKGDRVALLSYHAYADYDTAAAAQALRLPHELDGVPFPAEPLGCAMNVFERSAIQSGNHVAIIGIGFLGALLTRLASNVGARVTAISRRKFALDIAEQFGAEKLLVLENAAEVARAALEQTSEKGFDCVIEAAGQQETLDLATELTKERGRLVIAGYHQDGRRQINLQLWNWRGLDVINAHEREPRKYIRGMEAAIEAVLAGKLDPAPLYTHIYPLEDLPRALDMARTRPGGFLKALVIP